MAVCLLSEEDMVKHDSHGIDIEVHFRGLPVITPKYTPLAGAHQLNWIGRMAFPSSYSVNKDWTIKIKGFRTMEGEELSLHLVIPRGFQIDGRALPLPLAPLFGWIAIPRNVRQPVGLLLAARMIHEYAYGFGRLPKENGPSTPISRANADKLVQEIMQSANQTRVGHWLERYFGRPRHSPHFCSQQPTTGWSVPVWFVLLGILSMLVSITIQLASIAMATVSGLYLLHWLTGRS